TVYPLQQVQDTNLRRHPVCVGFPHEPAFRNTPSADGCGGPVVSVPTVADLLLARVGDHRPGLKSREATWSWDEVVTASATRAALARARRTDGPFHIGGLLPNVPEYVFWLGAAALAGATVVGINPTRGGVELEQEVAHTDCQLVVTDHDGLAVLDGLDIGVAEERFLLVDDADYAAAIAAHSRGP